MKHITPSHFQNEGDAIILVGNIGAELGASLYLREIHSLKRGRPPELDIEREKKMHDAVRAAIRSGDVRSAHDLAEGGLLVALAECAIGGGKLVGATVSLETTETRLDALLFGESQSRALISTAAEKANEVVTFFTQNGVPAKKIGTVGGDHLVVKSTIHSDAVTWNITDLHQAWDKAFDSYLS